MIKIVKKLKSFKALKMALATLWWGAVVGLALLLVSIIGAKLKGDVPRFFGYSVMQIVSGSMEDEIPTGTYILIKKVDAASIRQDDIICFFSDDALIQGYPNTHRVVEPPIQGENGLEFVTKGDANPIKDGVTAKEEKLIGRYVKNMDGLTSFSKMLEGNGMIILIMVMMIASAGMVTYSAITKLKSEAESPASEPSQGEVTDGTKTDERMN